MPDDRKNDLIEAMRRTQRVEALLHAGASRHDALNQGWMLMSAQSLVSLGVYR